MTMIAKEGTNGASRAAGFGRQAPFALSVPDELAQREAPLSHSLALRASLRTNGPLATRHRISNRHIPLLESSQPSQTKDTCKFLIATETPIRGFRVPADVAGRGVCASHSLALRTALRTNGPPATRHCISPCLRASVADLPASSPQQPESNRQRCRLETAVSHCKQTGGASSNRPSITPFDGPICPASLPPSHLVMPPASGLQRPDSHYNAGVPIKLIAMDLDGTLLDSASQLPRENADAIEEAAAQGLEIVIVTGRRFDSARAAAAGLACDAHFISSNGALIKSKDGTTHQRHLLPAAAARKVLEATPEFRFCTGVIFDRPHARQLIFEHVDWDTPFVGAYLRRHRDQVAEIAPLADCLDGEDPVEILFLAKCDEIRRVMGVLEALPSAHEFALALTEYESRNFSMLDVLRPGVTKGVALAEWARHRGIAPQDVMAIGDNWNDREMLAFAGLPVVMANSIAELKTLGYATTLSNDDAGVAAAIRKYALGTKP